jgi:hypothetical protein
LRLVRRLAEKHLDRPRDRQAKADAALLLESAGRRFGGVESFDDNVHDGARAPLVADQTQHMAGAIGGQTFEHGRRLARRRVRVTFPPGRWACILTKKRDKRHACGAR